MRSNSEDRWLKFLALMPRGSVDIALLQETKQYAGAVCQLRHPLFYMMRCDARTGMQGVAVAIRRTIVMTGTKPQIVFAHDANTLVVDFVDLFGRTRRVASLYFPSTDVKHRKEFIAKLPWKILSTAIVGCDSNLRTSPYDVRPPDFAIKDDALALLEKMRAHGLHDAWDIDSGAGRPFTYFPYQQNQSRRCIDRILVPMGLRAQLLSIYVSPAVANLSDHRPLCAEFGRFQRCLLPRVEPRAPTFFLVDDTIVARRVRKLTAGALRAVQRGARPIDVWQSLLPTISDELWRAHSALATTIAARRLANIKRRERRLQSSIADLLLLIDQAKQQPTRTVITEYRRKLAALTTDRQRIRQSYESLQRHTFLELKRKREQLPLEFRPNVSSIVQARDEEDVPSRIHMLRANKDAAFVTSPTEIHEIMREFWSKLRSNPAPVDARLMGEVLNDIVRVPVAADLTADLNLDDIETAIRLAKVSSPGCDRLDVLLYKRVPALAKLLLLVWQRRKTDGVPVEWKRSYVSMLPKPTGDTSTPAGYRPISVEPTAFRLICSAIQRKGAASLDAIVNIEQRAFVRAFGADGEEPVPRSILDAIAEAFGVAHHATNSNPVALLFFDFVKAYDTISREYLLRALTQLGCTQSYVDDMRLILTDTVSRILLNGHLGREFMSRCGVLQGNPLSCPLYIIAVSVIPALARRIGVRGFTPQLPTTSLLSLTGGVAPRLICNQFVDNLIGYASSSNDVECWFKALSVFAGATGQRCDVDATRIVQVPVGAALTPNAQQHLLVSGDGKVRVLGAYMSANGTCHAYTWDRALEKMQHNAARLEVLHATSGLRSRATAWRVLVLPTILFPASVLAVPKSVIERVCQLMVSFIFKSQHHPAASVVSEDLCDGGLTKHGGCGDPLALIMSLVARRFMAYLCERTRPIDEWLWVATMLDFAKLFGAMWSPLAYPRVNWPIANDKSYNPNSYAHFAATSKPIWHDVRDAEQLTAKRLQMEPVFCNALFGAHLTPTRELRSQLLRVKNFFSSSGVRFFGGAQSVLDHFDSLAAAWPALATAIRSPIVPVADFSVGNFVCIRDDSTLDLNGRIGEVTSISNDRMKCVVSVYTRSPWSTEHGPLLVESLVQRSRVCELPCSQCYRLVLSASGKRLFRSDNRSFDHRYLRILRVSTREECDITKAIDTALPTRAGMSTLEYAARERMRRELERKHLFIIKKYVPLALATAADLYRRTRSLTRTLHDLQRIDVHDKRFSFADLQNVFLSGPVFDFVWRLLHGKLAFCSWMSSAAGTRLARCPDCNLSLDDAKLCNDHVTLDCSGGLAVRVRDALDAWWTPQLCLFNQRLRSSFRSAWSWSLVPSRRRGWSMLTVMLVAIAKHRIWVHFTRRVFGGSHVDGVYAVSNAGTHRHHQLSDDAVRSIVDDSKSELSAVLRRAEQVHRKWFACVAGFARPLMA